jgi:hypothetical protein
VRLTGADDGVTTVATARRWAYRTPTVRQIRDGDRLVISARCSGVEHVMSFGACSVDEQVRVPAGAGVRVVSSAGGSPRSTSPSPTSTPVPAPVTSRLPSLRPHGRCPDDDRRRCALSVPYGSYRLDASTSAGDVEVGVIADPRASRLIHAHSTAGDVRVDPR